MEHGGDAVGDRLPVAVDQRHVGREVDAGARHHLPLERIAVQVDDAGQHQQATGIDVKRGATLLGVERADVATSGPQRGLDQGAVNQRAPALDENVRHDAALRCLFCDWDTASASYLSRNSSTASLRKSGRTRRSVS
ncbi:hypothetical protein ACVIM5_006207 [Bradyrhizobium sp. USDA 4512]